MNVKSVVAFTIGVLAPILAYVAARLFAIFIWQVEPGNTFGESLLGLASGAAMGLAAIHGPAWWLDDHESNRLSLVSFAVVGTFVAILSVVVLYAVYLGVGQASDSLMAGASAITIAVGYFASGYFSFNN